MAAERVDDSNGDGLADSAVFSLFVDESFNTRLRRQTFTGAGELVARQSDEESPIVRLGGDLNADGVVDAADLGRLLSNFGRAAAAGGAGVPGDLNRDGVVDGADLSLLLGGFGEEADVLHREFGFIPCEEGQEGGFIDGTYTPCTDGGDGDDGGGGPGGVDGTGATGGDGGGGGGGTSGGDGGDDEPPPPPDGCSVTIEGPKFIGVNAQATFSVSLEGGTAPDSVEWSTPSELVSFDPGALSDPTLALTAGEAPGMVQISVTATIDGQECSGSFELTIVSPKVQSVTFGGQRHNIVQDTGTAYDTPHWLDDALDEDAEDMEDRRLPIAYTRGAVVTVQELRIDLGAAPSGLQDVPVEGFGPDGQMFTATASLQGQTLVVTGPVEASAALPNTVRFYNPYTIAWEIALDEEGDTFMPAGESDNRIYATLNDPQASPLYETVIDIAVRNADSLNDVEAVAAGVYDDFTDRSVARKAADGFNEEDGAVMQYWLEANDPLLVQTGEFCQPMEVMINPEAPEDFPQLRNVGTCVAWSDLLHQAWRAQGITDSVKHVVVSVHETDLQWGPDNPFGAMLLVRGWTFTDPGTSACLSFPYRDFLDPNDGAPGDECVDAPGVPAQGGVANPPPAFFNHFITIRNGVFYDPSYGAPPAASHAAWESAALAGYTKLCQHAVNLGEAAARKDDPVVIETELIPLP